MKRLFQVSNPMETEGCDNRDCLPCRTGRGDGGRCLSSGANYTLECQLCPDGSKSRYIGETSRNLYTRGVEHKVNYRSGSPNSFMLKHQLKEHQGREGQYTAKVTANIRDCLTRQVREAVEIRRCEVSVLNGKTEWHQPPLWQIQNEILQGIVSECGTAQFVFLC